MLFRITLLACMLGLTACTNIKVTDYSDREPKQVLQDYFDGTLSAHGIVKDRAGRVIRTFNVDIVAYWQDGVGTLEEDFVYGDGSTQRRVWKLQPDDSGVIRGIADDVRDSSALKVSGNSLFMDYILTVPYGEGSIDVKVDDRMYLIAPDILVNESTMSKFGVRVGSIFLVMMRQPSQTFQEVH